jgi:hypothetical protein
MPQPGVYSAKQENDMAAEYERPEPTLSDRRDERSEFSQFGPVIAIVVAMPLAIVALTSAGLWFAAYHTDLTIGQRAPVDTFASRWVEPPKPETFIR